MCTANGRQRKAGSAGSAVRQQEWDEHLEPHRRNGHDAVLLALELDKRRRMGKIRTARGIYSAKTAGGKLAGHRVLC